MLCFFFYLTFLFSSFSSFFFNATMKKKCLESGQPKGIAGQSGNAVGLQRAAEGGWDGGGRMHI